MQSGISSGVVATGFSAMLRNFLRLRSSFRVVWLASLYHRSNRVNKSRGETITQGLKTDLDWSQVLAVVVPGRPGRGAKNDAPASALPRAHLPHSARPPVAVAFARAPLDDPSRDDASPDYGRSHAAHLESPRSAPQATRQETRYFVDESSFSTRPCRGSKRRSPRSRDSAAVRLGGGSI